MIDNTTNLRFTSEGILIPYTLIHAWLAQGVELVKETEQLIIRPKSPPLTEKERVLQILKASGILVSPMPLPPDFKPLSSEKKAELSRKLSIGRPLSEIIIEDRVDRV